MTGSKPPIPAGDAGDDGRTPDRPSNPHFGSVLAARLRRRDALKLMGAGAAAGAMAVTPAGRAASAAGPSTLAFREAARAITANHAVAPSYDARVLVRWGDPVLPGAPPFDPTRPSAAAQARQFGANADFVAYLPLPAGSGSSSHGVLCVNHEYADRRMMRPPPGESARTGPEAERRWVAVEMAAHGHSVVEVRRQGGRWRVVASRYARRITATDTMIVTGPAAGHPRLRTRADPSGRRVLGTINNCAGGTTPWGTVLTAEENFHYYFGGDPAGLAEARNHRRYGIKGRPLFPWHRSEPRFDVTREANEPNRFGWVVEIDPYDPASVPRKRSALGRFKHEAATVAVGAGGRVAVYSGDDEAGEYLYKFVARRRLDPRRAASNRDLLDDGVLHAARFNADGTLDWLPLVQGRGPLTPDNGFHGQADVCIESRRAADLVGATPMDRPEDVEVNPVTGRLYVMLTGNYWRGTRHPLDAANPRGPNRFGHIVEIVPPGGRGADADHAAARARWNLFLLAGDPTNRTHGARYHAATSAAGWLAAPDNCAFDPKGRLWITTDQGWGQAFNGIPDGVYACDTEGPGRALTRFFFAGPRDAELCGPAFTPDGRTLFLSVQHPGAGRGASYADPTSRWPDFRDDMPPRSAVVAITKRDGGEIGS